MATVGVIVNPLAGKDIRRLVTNASPVSDSAKIAMVRRAVVGAIEGGATRVLLSDDHHRLGRRAVADLDRGGRSIEHLDLGLAGDRTDTVAAAMALRDEGAGAIVVFGGDGTHRDVVSGWRDAPLVPVSTGTNNVFPIAWDATSAGTAAGLVAAGLVPLGPVSHQATRIEIVTSSGRHDVALVDVALVDGSFVGARAVWDPSSIRTVVAVIAEPATSGLSSIAGRVHPVAREAHEGVVVHLGDGHRRVRLPLSPGTFVSVGVVSSEVVPAGGSVTLEGPGVLTLDGERTIVLHPHESATTTVRADGPLVIDVAAALRHAVERRAFDHADPVPPPHHPPVEETS
ncbi:MAG: NAD(+)/NADH kinase, partial [Ilumatobacteraceae bacterium]|nr:NAD(+)/NADH kinase [Ilumatobacteraceae bacterium]